MTHRRVHIGEFLEQPVAVGPGIRIALALVVSLGGAAFFVVGLIFVFAEPNVPPPHPFAARALSGTLAVLGLGFLFVASRLVRRSAATRGILGPVARRNCGLIVGALALASALFSWQVQSIVFAVSAVFTGVFSYWLFRSAARSKS